MKKFIFAIAAVMSLASCNQSGKVDLKKLDEICAGTFPQGKPGAAVLVMKGDDVIFEKCYGIANYDDGSVITPETSFNIASVSKQFTAVAVLQLCEQGRLSLEDNVNKYFPEFTDSIWDNVKVWHLLSHSSGLPDTRSGIYTYEQRLAGNDDMAVEYFPTLHSLNFEPGTLYEYINPTFVLAARIVERITGEEFTQYVHDHIFAPAGMDRTVYFDPEHQELIPNLSHGYWQNDNGEWEECDYGETTFFATRPDGGIYTSIRDFAKWEIAQRECKVLAAETLSDAQSPHILVSGSPLCDYQNRPNTWYGYGWFIEPATDSSEKVIYHTGDNGGYQIMAARYPDSGTLILIFSNRNDWDRYETLQKIESAVL